ncbi:uncharacterized protein LOC135209631 [Macrobrachium nipponense]|uniref:uncharacterized protein LOC135209631 n=1 Tax=Macrobrachium nipponense TaxID=159736 RepID=UPI0030C7A4E6
MLRFTYIIFLLLLVSAAVRITTCLDGGTPKTLQQMSVYEDTKALLRLGMAKRNSESYKELDFRPGKGDSRIPGVATAVGRFTMRSVPHKRETPNVKLPHQNSHRPLDFGGHVRSLRHSPPNPHFYNEIYSGPYKPVAPEGVDNSWYVGPDPSLKAQGKRNEENKEPEVANDDSQQDQEPVPEISTNIDAPTLHKAPVTFAPEVAHQEAEILADDLDDKLKELPPKLVHLYSRNPSLLLRAKPLRQAPKLFLCPGDIDGGSIDIETLTPGDGFRRPHDRHLFPPLLHKPRLCI